jgi:translation initiation factor 3 subunit A
MQKEQNFDTGDLINLQVQHIEKEKREMNVRLRVIAKRIDHLERAYRKEERPLVAQDYERQQANDRETFKAVQVARRENAKVAHQEALATKKRLSRVMDDYLKRKEALIAKKGEEFAKKRDTALKKIEEEKAKRRKAILAEREAERKRFEEEERIHREKEEEERRREAGKFLSFIDSRAMARTLSRTSSRRRAHPCRGRGCCCCRRSCETRS